MIFHRRVIQAELENLRNHLDGYVVNRLVKRLNAGDRDRLAAMWEVLVFSALCELGRISVEAATKSGSRPDILFHGSPIFIADITSISDQGLEDRNPVSTLAWEIERAKAALGLPSGGLDYRVGSVRRRAGSGKRVDLRIPRRSDIPAFVERRIAPQIKLQLEAGSVPIRIAIDDDEAELTIVIDPSKGPYNTGGYASYDVCESVDRNPFAHALQRKADQLREADGLKGIFVCDTGSASIHERPFSRYGFSPRDIVRHFLRANGHIDFVMTLSVWQEQTGALHRGPPDRRVDVTLYSKPGLVAESDLMVLRDKLAARIPKPSATGGNGRRQARQEIYKWGFHGGFVMTGKSVKISLREMSEILAGVVTVHDINERERRPPGQGRTFPEQFRYLLEQGRLPAAVSIEPGGAADDDWIKFEFGEPDAAISKFR